MKSLHFVACTRGRKEDTDLYRSLVKLGATSYQFFENNQSGLPTCYNQVLEERAGREEIVVLVHDDVTIVDIFVQEKLNTALDRYGLAVVGLAGSRVFDVAPAEQVTKWLWPNKGANSGAVEHVAGDDRYEFTYYGPTPQRCIVMDGLFLAVDMMRIGSVRFDERFHFHFYDLDFCLAADQHGLMLGTSNVHVQHASAGSYGSASFMAAQEKFRSKWNTPGRGIRWVGSDVIVLESPALRTAFHSGPLSKWMVPLCDLPLVLPKSAWEGHIPFLSLLMHLQQPRRLVELGVYLGGSFLAACAFALRFDAATQCFGIDTWEGDAHAGRVEGDRIFGALNAFVSKHYPAATLIRSTFDGALAQFDDCSIDLLHIDGLHTYEAVSHDFRSWLPRLSDRSIVLFHDTEVRERDFGVWRLWAELKQRYRNFEFHHSYGLGVLMVGDRISPELDELLQYAAKPEGAGVLRQTCEILGKSLPSRVSWRDKFLATSASGDATPVRDT